MIQSFGLRTLVTIFLDTQAAVLFDKLRSKPGKASPSFSDAITPMILQPIEKLMPLPLPRLPKVHQPKRIIIKGIQANLITEVYGLGLLRTS